MKKTLAFLLATVLTFSSGLTADALESNIGIPETVKTEEIYSEEEQNQPVQEQEAASEQPVQ
ncbi:MAG: hypothetical protein NC121_02380, partial [Blautia sp.]|nr:hypothetical protein [Blautia sp.]